MKKWAMLLPIVLLGCRLSADESEFARRREAMVKTQIMERGITDAPILDALRRVKRHLFVLPAYVNEAYNDYPLPIDQGQTISQPYIVAIMTYVIAPDAKKKVLEIGTGSGYQAAILAELAGQVYTIEINKVLAEKSRRLLTGLGYRNIHFRVGDGYFGWPEFSSFDGIIVTCSPDHIPQPLIDQLALGGRMVIPITYSSSVQYLIMIEKDKTGKLKRTDLIPVQFLPLIHSGNTR